MRRTLARVAGIFLFALTLLPAHAQGVGESEVSAQTVEQRARALTGKHQWQSLADLLRPVEPRSANLEFLYGTALAHLDRWDEAERAFASGRGKAPADERFPVELAGVAFHFKHYPRAARLLRSALRLDPHDGYANEFLATVYYLEGNLPAALKYWNRVGKPQVADIRQDPPLQVDQALLDRAFVFAPQSQMRLRDYLDTRTRLDGLGIFPQFKVELPARDDGRFDAVLRAQELNGLGNSPWPVAAALAVGLPFQSVRMDAYNLCEKAINFTAFYRWDAQKRRIEAHLSLPLKQHADLRWNFGLELRGENWEVRDSFTGPAPLLGSLNLRREAVRFDLISHASDRLQWSAGGELSHRDFRSVVAGPALTTQLLADGYELKQIARVESVFWRVPERRFSLSGSASSQAARLWSRSPETFEKLSGSLGWNWLPLSQSFDYAMKQTLNAGKTWGTIPFDELTMLGLERDNGLPMRGHIGTRDGKKGSAPLGRDYLLSNWEMDKKLYSNGIVSLQIGPFIDMGTISDSNAVLGSHKWLCDVGGQTKFRVFGRGIAFSYGKDLRTGNNAFYVSILSRAAALE